MKTRLVVDTSIWIKLIDGSNEEIEAIEGFVRMINKGVVEAICPTLACLEMLNVLVRFKKTDKKLAFEFLKRLELVGVKFIAIEMEDLDQITGLMIKHGLTAYDGCFLYLATKDKMKLLTADKKLLDTPMGISLSQLAKLF